MNFLELTATDSTAGMVLEAPAVRVPLPDRFRSALGAIAGRQVVAGIRPEHLDLGEALSTDAIVEGVADVVEYLGREELIHVGVDGRDVLALISAEHRVRPGDLLRLRMPNAKVYLFDPETGRSLIPPADPAFD